MTIRNCANRGNQNGNPVESYLVSNIIMILNKIFNDYRTDNNNLS